MVDGEGQQICVRNLPMSDDSLADQLKGFPK